MQATAAALRQAQEESIAASSIPLQLQEQLRPRDGHGGPAALVVRSPSRLQAAVAQEQANLVRLTADFKASTVKATTFFTNLLVKVSAPLRILMHLPNFWTSTPFRSSA
jgi:hypothetical protein